MYTAKSGDCGMFRLAINMSTTSLPSFCTMIFESKIYYLSTVHVSICVLVLSQWTNLPQTLARVNKTLNFKESLTYSLVGYSLNRTLAPHSAKQDEPNEAALHHSKRQSGFTK